MCRAARPRRPRGAGCRWCPCGSPERKPSRRDGGERLNATVPKTSNACSRAQGLRVWLSTETTRVTRAQDRPHATRLPAEAVTRAGPRQDRSIASHRTRPPALGARRAGRSSDFADTDRSIHLLALASQALRPSACEDVRFRLPLRGSSGFAPDSLLSPTDSRVWTGTDGHNISGRIAVVNPNTWCSGCLAACGSVAPLGRKSNRLAMPA